MTTRLTLVCHAMTSAVRRAAFPVDEPIDERGKADAAALAVRLRRADRCWTSPALRARQTAEALGLDATVDPALAECDYGRWTGSAYGDVVTQDPDGMAAWIAEPGAAPHGGESIVGLIARVGKWLEACNQYSGHTIAVTHASVIRAAIVHAIRADAMSFWRIDIEPLSLTDLRRHDAWTVRSMGRLLEP